MLGDCDLFPCFRRRKPDIDRDPVLLVPGIASSILKSKNKRFGCENRAWVQFLCPNREFKKRMWSKYNPEIVYTESLDVKDEIVVPNEDDGLYAIDILDPSWFAKSIHLTDLYYFHDMIDMLVGCGYKKGTTLFGQGYDFRQSNRIDKAMDDLKLKLETAYKASGGRKVFEKYVNKWICIACPFRGAPAYINDAILRGLKFFGGWESHFFVKRWTMHQLLVECPSIYEMLPNPEFMWKHLPQIQVWRKQSEGVETCSVKLESYGPTESITLFEEALRDNKKQYDGNTIPLPFNFCILEWAAETRQILKNAHIPNGVNFYNIFGMSFNTPFDVCYGSETTPIKELSEVCHSEVQYCCVDGDGAVPTESAKADGLAATARIAVRATHPGLLSDKTVFHLIQEWLGVDQKSAQHSKTSRVMDEFSKQIAM